MQEKDAFMEAILRDLRELSPDLIEAGAAPATYAISDARSTGSLSHLLRLVRRLCHSTPGLINNLELHTFGRVEEYATRNPRNAVLPTRAHSYELVNNRLLPKEWSRLELAQEFDLHPLGFLLHLLGELLAQVTESESRIGKYLEDALAARDLDSVFAKEETTALRLLQNDILCAGADIRRSIGLVRAKAGYKLEPTLQRPKPFPRSSDWAKLRRIADEVQKPQAALPANIHQLLRSPIQVADRPFLYQRWCGAMLLSTFERMGWTVMCDRVPALFLGGKIPLRKDDVTIALWVEPRLTSRGAHASQLHATRAREASPDLLLTTSGPSGKDAFILDPTLASNQGEHAKKSKYLRTLAFDALPNLAGQPVHHTPLRSWAAAPIRLQRCQLESANGRAGTVPMHPLHFDRGPLKAWLFDIEAHALAWGCYHLTSR